MGIVECMVFKDPTIMLVISFFLGEFGVDRFMLGDTKNGVYKLLLLLFAWLIIPGIAIFVWGIMDIFKMNDMTTEYNYKELINSSSYI